MYLCFTMFKDFILTLMKKKEFWQAVINVILAIVSAIATTMGLQSCMAL